MSSNSVLKSLTLQKHEASFTEAESLGCHRAVKGTLDLGKRDFNTPAVTGLYFKGIKTHTHNLKKKLKKKNKQSVKAGVIFH